MHQILRAAPFLRCAVHLVCCTQLPEAPPDIQHARPRRHRHGRVGLFLYACGSSLAHRRVKIGFHIALKLLRAGSRVIVTTRFPSNSLQRFAQEADWAELGGRLQIYGLDMRNLTSVEEFCEWVAATYERLDVIINNACQTVRRPAAYYKHLMEGEVDGSRAPAPQLVSSSSYQSNCQAIAHGSVTEGAVQTTAARYGRCYCACWTKLTARQI